MHKKATKEQEKILSDKKELAAMRQAGADDCLKYLGHISEEEYNYYKNICAPSSTSSSA